MDTGVCGRKGFACIIPTALVWLGFLGWRIFALWFLYIMSFSETLLYVECNQSEPFRLMIARWKEKMTWR